MTCRVRKLARQPYYRWLANPMTDAELAEAYRADALLPGLGPNGSCFRWAASESTLGPVVI